MRRYRQYKGIHKMSITCIYASEWNMRNSTFDFVLDDVNINYIRHTSRFCAVYFSDAKISLRYHGSILHDTLICLFIVEQK